MTTAGPTASPAATPTGSPLGQVDATLKAWEREQDLSCATLVTRGGDTVFEGCYGLADRAHDSRVTPRTRFGLASVTKMFTAVAVADLVGRGRLTFDTAVVDVLPSGRRPSTLREDVTVHHLLSHTSGIADYAEEDEDLPGYVEDYGSLWTDLPSYRVERPADFLPLFGDLAPYSPPGERYRYSNAGFILLGLVVEEVTGRAYADVVQDRILDRAGMDASGFFRLDEDRPDVAVGYLPPYLPERDVSLPSRTNIYSVPVVGGPDGGLFSTTHDLDRFLRAYSDGTLLGGLTEVMVRPHAAMDGDDGFRTGYGVHLYPDGRYGHGGGDPGVEVLVHRWPERDMHLVVLCNMEGLAAEVRDLLVESLLT